MCGENMAMSVFTLFEVESREIKSYNRQRPQQYNVCALKHFREEIFKTIDNM